MYTRREFLGRSSLVTAGSLLPAFVVRTALGAEPGQDNILVVVELTGGNDGLNTVIPYADDLYQKARPTLAYGSDEVVRIDDQLGLHPSLNGLSTLLEDNNLAIVQGVGYPNPNRSHFESMDIWQSADPTGRLRGGWLARSLGDFRTRRGGIAAFHLDDGSLPLAMRGSGTAIPTVNADKPFGLRLDTDGQDDDRQSLGSGGDGDDYADHRRLIRRLAGKPPEAEPSNLLQFVQRTSVETYKTVDRLHEIMTDDFSLPGGQYRVRGGQYRMAREGIGFQLTLAARMIQSGFGTRIFYTSLDGFDTHGDQKSTHESLLTELGDAVGSFFSDLSQSGDAERVLLMTYSEFGRRVRENAGRGTDHGAASSMFIAGPAVKGGVVGEHPSLAPDDLVDGDLKYHTDFRQVYATLLDNWLGVDSRRVLGEPFEILDLGIRI